jgi:hypothetical protein
MTNKLNKREFMNEVEKRLDTYSLDTLQNILRTWANQLPSMDRTEFLHKLEPQNESQKYIQDKELIRDIQEFYKKIENGDYCTGWGWDDEIQDERDWGDECWAIEMDGFFRTAEYAYLNGDYELAVDAYKVLFEILDMCDESGHFPGAPNPENMLETDLVEARNIYLRSVYFATPVTNRPIKLLSIIQEFEYYIGDDLNIQSINNAGQAQLPEFDQFLPTWIKLLKKDNNQYTNYLLREAVLLSGGVSALENLANEEGKEHPRVFVDWLITLEKETDYSTMISAAKKGLEIIPKDWIIRAEVAKGLVRAGKHQANLQEQLLGWHEAFYSDPNLSNLLSLRTIAEKNDSVPKELENVVERVTSLLDSKEKKEDRIFPPDPDTLTSRATPLLLAQVYLLSGRIDEAVATCQDKGSIGWTYHYSDNPKGLVVPFLLRLISKNSNMNSTPNLEIVWKEALENTLRSHERNPGDLEELQKIMNNIIESVTLSKAKINQYLMMCEQETCNRVDAIVSGKYRGSYHKAAKLLIAMAEVLEKLNLKSKSIELVEKYRKKYNNHRAFQHELKISKKRLK